MHYKAETRNTDTMDQLADQAGIRWELEGEAAGEVALRVLVLGDGLEFVGTWRGETACFEFGGFWCLVEAEKTRRRRCSVERKGVAGAGFRGEKVTIGGEHFFI